MCFIGGGSSHYVVKVITQLMIKAAQLGSKGLSVHSWPISLRDPGHKTGNLRGERRRWVSRLLSCSGYVTEPSSLPSDCQHSGLL